jgi:hypothetical protein
MSLQVGDQVIVRQGPSADLARVTRRTPMYVDVGLTRYHLRTGRASGPRSPSIWPAKQEDLDRAAAVDAWQQGQRDLDRLERDGALRRCSAAQLRAAAEAIGAAVRALRGEP